jgi:hypothetical protein
MDAIRLELLGSTRFIAGVIHHAHWVTLLWLGVGNRWVWRNLEGVLYEYHSLYPKKLMTSFDQCGRAHDCQIEGRRFTYRGCALFYCDVGFMVTGGALNIKLTRGIGIMVTGGALNIKVTREIGILPGKKPIKQKKTYEHLHAK